MASRYWVGGSDTWDATAGTKWATTSGGAGGASAPGTSDAVFLDAASGAVTVTLGADVSISSVDQTGFTGTLNWAGYEISLASPGATPWTGATTCTNAGTPRIRITYTGSSNLNVRMGATTEANAVSCVFVGNSGNNTADGNYKNLDFGNCSGANPNNARTVYGNLTLSPLASGSGVNGTTLGATSGTQVITSNGATFDFPITANCPGATVQLADALTLGSTRTFTLTNGSLDLNGFNLTTGLFSSSNANARSITSGAGQFYCTAAASSGTSIPFNANVTTNLTFADRPTINLTGNGSGTAIRQIYLVVGQTEALAPDVNVTAGTDTVAAAVTTNMPMRNLNFTGFSGVLSGSVRGLYGNLTLSPTMTAAATVTSTTFAATSGTQVITSNGVTLDFSIVVSAVGGTVQLADALTMGSTRTFTLTNGSLNLNGFNLTAGGFSSSNANVRSITSGAGQFYCIGGTSFTLWTTATATNLTLVDRPTIYGTGTPTTSTRTIATAAHAEAVAPNVYVTGGSDSLNISGAFLNVTTSGHTGGATLAPSTIYGNLTLGSGSNTYSSASAITFAATSGTQVITSNGVGINTPVTVNCPGATVQLADAFNMAQVSYSWTLTDGSFNANNFNVTAGLVRAGAAFDTLTLGSGTWSITGSGPTAFSINAAVTVVCGTSTVLMTSATAKTFVGAGKTYYNLSNGGAGALTITGANTYNDLQNTVTPATFTLPASTTTTVSALSLQGTSGNLVTLNSSTPATRATLSKASGTVDVSYLSIKDSAATGGATFLAVPDNGNIDAGNNTGWKFSFIDVDVSGVEALGLIAQALVWALVDDGNTVTWVEIPT